MARYEFPKKVKQAALERADYRCEGAGERYGLPDGVRCNNKLDSRTEFDHWPIPAMEPGSDVLENCVACCYDCHRYATAKYDTPRAAKERRIRERSKGLRKSKRPMPGGRKSKFKKKIDGTVERRDD